MRAGRGRRTGGEGSGVVVAIACVAVAVGLYLASTLVWHLEDVDDASPATRVTRSWE